MAQMDLEELIDVLMDAGSVELDKVQMEIGDLVLDIGGEAAASPAVSMIQNMVLGITQNIQVPLAHLNTLEKMLLGQRKY